MTTPKRPRDTNQLAHMIAMLATGELADARTEDGKDPAAVALGRKGGLKGGKARAQKLSSQKRSEIAKIAARSRWSIGRGGNMATKWRKKLTKSDAQQPTRGALMPFLRFTKGNLPVNHKTFFRNNFFANLVWQSAYSGKGHHKETAAIKIRVKLSGNDLGVRTMIVDHDPSRSGNHSAPTTHLLYDSKTRRALESANLAGHQVTVEDDGSGNFSLTVQ